MNDVSIALALLGCLTGAACVLVVLAGAGMRVLQDRIRGLDDTLRDALVRYDDKESMMKAEMEALRRELKVKTSHLETRVEDVNNRVVATTFKR